MTGMEVVYSMSNFLIISLAAKIQHTVRKPVAMPSSLCHKQQTTENNQKPRVSDSCHCMFNINTGFLVVQQLLAVSQ